MFEAKRMKFIHNVANLICKILWFCPASHNLECYTVTVCSYETANGISASEYGVYKPGATNDEGIQSASGSYSYTGPDNVVYTITYTAGVEGFVPQGAHIPTPPPVPEAIQKILQFAGENTKYGQEYEDFNASNKYTSAVPTPYAGYNANYNRITSARGTEYKVLDSDRKWNWLVFFFNFFFGMTYLF